MPYRDERRCHICGTLTRVVCPSCQNPVCAEHTLAGRAAGGPARAQADAERLARRVGGPEACTACVERELQASQGPFVAIMRSSDPIETQMVVEALLEEGFDARAIGTQNAALLGAGQSIFEQRIEVPEPQAGEAQQLARSLVEQGVELEHGEHDGDDADDADDDDDDDDDDAGSTGLAPRRRGIAAGLAFIFPGGSHYYARHPWTGMLLTAAFFVGLLLLARGEVHRAAALLIGVPVLDLVAGQLAIEPCNRGAPRSVAVQLGLGLGLGGALLLGATLLL